MITKFDSLYAGHTDLDNIGYGGTPINERSYSNAHLATALSKAESMATLMDGLGYNCFWMAEHHFQREGTEPQRRILWAGNLRVRQIAGRAWWHDLLRGESSLARRSGIRRPQCKGWRDGGSRAIPVLQNVPARPLA